MNSEYTKIYNSILGGVNSSSTFYPLSVRRRVADQAIVILEEYDKKRVFTTSNPKMTD